MYRLCSIKKGTSRQAPFGVWGPEGTNGTGERWPITLNESWGEYCLERQTGEADELMATLPQTATGVQLYDALAEAEGLLSWADARARSRAEMVQAADEPLDADDERELADFDAGTEAGWEIPQAMPFG